MRKLSTQKGFTLVEMIISLGIFTIVALVAVGALMKIMDANKRSISLKTSINNLNFALESMARDLRVGGNYSCSQNGTVALTGNNIVTPSDCSYLAGAGDWYIFFNSSKMDAANTCNLVYSYKYDSVALTLSKSEQTSCTGGSPLNFVQMISPDIKISTAIINVSNTSPTNTLQPKVFLYLNGTSGQRAKDMTEFSLQTTISQRLPK